ncbi:MULTISPECIES: SRPBCC domain-containing protein [unclassified Mesorhizobium]|uniref:SRPBCC family protein n=1 Tax=unclassified Mesorhizobium TaxID=325217 RepID=UPI001126346A|nr:MULTISPECIES: SRPBCC domain-containing protein [unclassified Mesorhizobium]MBZ9922435.1 SRPBCC domain-containing protein [Mesorhizobium sp. BR1-1-7]MBZ9953947.1 SRPBCC domain-containing protein [Mesorhizobium sp. BR1-1-15]MBZ9970633.1 SRPBCC domain-containing protein [Mesorhizobium sp. BR1-1-12]MBZ9970868.1 SRPBCC domain-containing protein [Mesorhizobium sp. BR1-1-12]MBZ9983186.1 SRPBCC domain-containing protein [Mesorhizobium sp. BR-1-1-8]
MNDSAADTRTVVVERQISHPPEKLWRALTQPHLIEEWLMKNDLNPVVGHRFNLSTAWGGVLDCEVLAVEPHKTLSYTWNLAHQDPAFDLRSVVTFTLTPTPAGTHLRMEQSGFRPEQRRAYGGAKMGWPKFLEKLEELLARTD